METLEMKEKLHHYIDIAQEDQLQAIYTLLEEKIEIAEGRISLSQYNKELEESEQEYEDGNFITQQEFINEIKQWQSSDMK